MTLSLFALKSEQLCEALTLTKPYQGVQIYNWLNRGVADFTKMTDLPLSLRDKLSARLTTGDICIFSSSVIEKQTDSENNIKLALKLHDNSVIECVLLSDEKNEYTACLSSQVGCAMGCAFCRTATLGLKRNLQAFEIIEQFWHLQMQVKEKISHIVFMGMGEPLANIDNVSKAIEFLNDKDGIGISQRRITISTCGLVNGIEKLALSGLSVRLAVSLVSAIDEKRSSLMPINKVFNLSTLKRALLNYQKQNSRRFTLEYCMISQNNIGMKDAQALASFCKDLLVIVNLIPFNPCPELPFETPEKSEINSFTAQLDKLRVPYTIRKSRGRSIRGACGQLATGKL